MQSGIYRVLLLLTTICARKGVVLLEECAESNRFSPYTLESFPRIQNKREKNRGAFEFGRRTAEFCPKIEEFRVEGSPHGAENYQGILWISPERRRNKELAATLGRIQKISRKEQGILPLPPVENTRHHFHRQTTIKLTPSPALNWIKGHVMDSPALSRRRRSIRFRTGNA
jgi:hypothetical protein